MGAEQESDLTRRHFLQIAASTLAAGNAKKVSAGPDLPGASATSGTKPNIVFILSDDLGYGDLGCYGQRVIQTPNLNRMAAEGTRFTHCYAGSTVCAPSRCCLMTGMHTGHATIRGNANVPLRPEDVTVAEILRGAGYATGLVGKWGLGEPDTTGIPNRKGFDEFFGYLNQGHAHNYYPDYLWRNESKVPLAGNVVTKGVASARAHYAPDLFTEEALNFIHRHRAHPFFLYLAYTIPHANNERGAAEGNGMEVPSDAPYSDQPWSQIEKNHAAMITRLDRDVGRVFATLKELGLDDNTIVFFSSDNGPHKEGGASPAFFHSSGPFRGIKRDLYEGGIRVPMIARWPGHVRSRSVSDYSWAFWDVLPTLADIANAGAPAGLDGVSVAPAVLKTGGVSRRPPEHSVLYWEFHERGFQQAARDGRWKAVRTKWGAPLELYDLKKDPGETRDVSRQHTKIRAKLEKYLQSARTDSKHWPAP